MRVSCLWCSAVASRGAPYEPGSRRRSRCSPICKDYRVNAGPCETCTRDALVSSTPLIHAFAHEIGPQDSSEVLGERVPLSIEQGERSSVGQDLAKGSPACLTPPSV
jgi:hypothetical protein